MGYRCKIIFDAVPKKPTGKIEKQKLREKYIGKQEYIKGGTKSECRSMLT